MPITRRNFIKAGVALAATAPLCDFQTHADPMPNKSPVDLVNTLQGTDSKREFSRGNTLPIVARPFGMTHWIPQSNMDDRWFFDPKVNDFIGVRATHMPCPWAGDYGNFTVIPSIDADNYSSEQIPTFANGNLVVHPYYFSVLLQESKIKIETTATERCGVIRFTFPEGHKSRVGITSLSHAEINIHDFISGSCDFGSRPAQPKNASCYFAAEFNQPMLTGYQSGSDGEVGVMVEFEPNGPLIMRIGTSFISVDQALTNLKLEVADKTFDQLCAEAKDAWNELLSCAVVTGGTLEEQRTFYSCLYRTKIFPRVLHEYTADGQQIHFSSADGKVHPGPCYGDTGFWDTYRTQFPLLSILEPKRLGEMIKAFLTAYEEGGWLPQWPSPGWGFSMPGTHGDSVVADALVKNITGFDRTTAYAAVKKDADVPGTVGGRYELTEYIEKGYIPMGNGPAAASTWDYAYDDFCASQAAAALGDTHSQQLYRLRSLNYRNLFDSSVGFLNGKHDDGTWERPFDPITWGGQYIEAAAWQSTWTVPHDVGGLINLMGGRQKFVEKLDGLLLQSPRFNVGTYGQVIHEMAEMAAFEFGQYDQGNQPVHIALYLFAAAGCPWKTQYYTRRVLREMYSPDIMPGDDDNGEMSAWYVLSALGIFPLCPSYPTYMLTSPLFPSVRLKVGDGKELQITASGNSSEAVYVNGVHVNGKIHKHTWITHEDIANGGELQFTMGSTPTSTELQTEDMPFSITPISGPIPTASFATSIRISCGADSDNGDFVADAFFNGGAAVSDSDLIYPSMRIGKFVYNIPLPTPPAPQSYTVRLHFPEPDDSPTERRVQNIWINGQIVLPDFDASKSNPSDGPITHSFEKILPNKNGRIEINVWPSKSSPKQEAALSAIEIFSSNA